MRSIRDIFRSYAVFDADGRHVNGTDKESNHRYGDAYEKIFFDRAGVSLMMEVGVADGSSLLAWSEVFPGATVVGLDIHAPARIGWGSSSRGRVEFHLGDQRSSADCERAVGGRQFDVIVEDATHQLENTLLTLYHLWPHVRPGGLYVVEEWDGVGGDRDRIVSLFPNAIIVDTFGPFGGIEPLVVMRKTT